MSLHDKLKPFYKIFKIASLIGSGGAFVSYHVYQTYKFMSKIVNHEVLSTEKKQTAEYIYIDDPAYSINLLKEQNEVHSNPIGFSRIWKSLKHSLAWRLLWLCRHGNKEQRNVALSQLAAFKKNKDWDCLKLAQAMDKNTAVLLARTRGADLRYFLPPPLHVRRAAITTALLSFQLRDMIGAVHKINQHSCIQHFLTKYFTNDQEHAVEADSVPAKPDSIGERDLCIQCLDALYHHLNLFYNKSYDDNISVKSLVNLGFFPKIAELMLRNRNDKELDLAVLNVLTILSSYTNLLVNFYENGLLGELSRLIRSSDVRLSSSAAVCLANLSGEYCYRPGIYLLHPLYRTNKPFKCDTLLVHGLRGGVFVTWRQRDKKCAEPLGIIEVTVSDNKCADSDNCNPTKVDTKYLDPEIQQVVEDILELEDEALLADYEIALHDLPIQAKREPSNPEAYTIVKKRIALLEEEQDKCNYTFCWPKDWLPNDCRDLRILGVNYWTSLSDWLERCPSHTSDLDTRASEFLPSLMDAGVGTKSTPVIWLAHSMGGLVVKQLLKLAAQSSDTKRLCDCTKALFFYSTPHKGSSFAKMPRPAAAILWPSTDVKQLEENSPELLELQNSFIALADLYNWETVSFVETKPTLVTAFKVPIHFVHSFSADLGRGVFYELPLDHLTICKPATRQSILYTAVLSVIQKVIGNEAVEWEYSHPFLNWILTEFNVSLKNRFQGVVERLDDTQTNNNLNWIEKILLEAFTDGFTD